MASFSAVNTSLAIPDGDAAAQEPTPTTPRPAVSMADRPDQDPHAGESAPSTPTRHSFGGVPGQRPLPDEPLTPAKPKEQAQDSGTPLKRDGSHLSKHSQEQSEDVEMGEADDGEDDASDNESVTSESRPNKKKKGQRFFCTDFPPCQLSFTRSEHLARHIRKHTGERPFQCHCSRRFSRLDNLRQHAQTVHVNEDIPGDSLAATSTRFQRQIRTDRVRPPNSRSRASTLGSQGGHSRGHSRNLSTSSIGSTTSSVGVPDDIRRRPQPLAMANDPTARARLSLETYNNGMAGSPSQGYVYYNQSPSGFSTPTSTTFSTGGQSPRFQSNMASPISTISRSSFYNGARSHGRRLSVPSGQNPFQNQHSSYPPVYFSPLPSGQAATFSPHGSVYASPTSSVFSHGRRESESEMEYRRRTWHPSTNSQYAPRPATSGLTYHQTPDEPRPAFTQQQAASQMTRLPGIESFDHAPPPGVRPQQPSPMMVDASPRPPSSSGRQSDVGLQQGLTRLDITAANAQADGQWQLVGSQQPVYYNQQAPQSQQQQFIQPKHMSMPEQPITPRKNKRNAWYGGPLTPSQVQPTSHAPHRPSPEDSGSSDGVPTPSTNQIAEYNPVIVNPNNMNEYPAGTAITDGQKVYNFTPGHQGRTDSGYQDYQPQHTYNLQAGHDAQFAQSHYSPDPNNDMTKLEALVAVATSEGNRAVEHRS